MFFFWKTLAAVSLVLGLGLEHSCPWPPEGLFSERLSLALDFFCVLGLGFEPCVLDSTSAYKRLFQSNNANLNAAFAEKMVITKCNGLIFIYMARPPSKIVLRRKLRIKCFQSKF